ncbi:MAG TPA: AI-2E family transporter [Acidimicrobiales bacterium]
MPETDGTEATRGSRRLYISPRSVVLVFAAIGVALVARNMVERSTRVLGWLAAAVATAALVYPLVGALGRYIRRGFALVVVVVILLGTIGMIVYAAVDDVRTELDNLQEIAPEAAQRIEESDRYGETAREFRLRERVESFVEGLPERLAGGDTAEVVRSATTRGIAYFVSFILTLFLVLHGPKIVRAGINQIGEPERRERVAHVLSRAYTRACSYLLGSLGIALATGLYSYLWCRLADLPGATVLSIFVALWSLVPYVGIAICALPVALLALGLDIESAWPYVLLVVFVAWQVFDAAVMRRQLTRRSIAVGPAVTILVAMLGIDLYGIGGALVGFAFAVFVIAVVDQLAPTDEHAVDLRVITG